MVIFGAGASYDSLADYPIGPIAGLPAVFEYRPPLAAGLFQKRELFNQQLARYPECVPIVTKLRMLLSNTNLERELEKLQAEAEHYPIRHAQLSAIRYYLRGAIRESSNRWRELTQGVTNYAALMDVIGNWQAKSREPVRLVTFNYDTLLEDACSWSVGLKVTNIHSYVSRHDFMIFKPHGSVNWVRTVDNPSPVGGWSERHLINLGNELRLRPGQHVVPHGVPEDQSLLLEGKPTYPAIAIPFERKEASHFECPADHLEKLKESIPAVTRLAVVGWRGTEMHFLQYWHDAFKSKEKGIEVLIVGWQEAETMQVQNNLQMAGIKGRFHLIKDGFTQFVVRKDLEQFLAR